MEKKLSEHEIRIRNNEDNIREHGVQLKQFTSLVIDIHDLVSAVKGLQEEIICQGRRLSDLEKEPITAWNETKKTAKNTIVSILAGALAMGLLWALSNGIHFV